MAKAFLNYQDTVMRLSRTICMYDGKPMFVTIVEPESPEKYDNDIGLYSLNPMNSKAKFIKVTSKEFSYQDIPLGYMLMENECSFLVRNPERKNSQGLTAGVIICTPRFQNYGPSSWFRSQAMANCILGIHKTYDQAIGMLEDNDNITCVPFHRYFAVGYVDASRRVKAMYFRGRAIGLLNQGNQVNLFETPDASFIRGTLQKLGVL